MNTKQTPAAGIQLLQLKAAFQMVVLLRSTADQQEACSNLPTILVFECFPPSSVVLWSCQQLVNKQHDGSLQQLL